jgi:signal transduction histidine kinase
MMVSGTHRTPEQDLNRLRPAALDAAPDAVMAEFDALREIGHELNSTLDVEQVLNALIRASVRITPAVHGSVLLIDEQKRLRLGAWHGYVPQEMGVSENPDVFRKCGVLRQVLATGQLALVNGDELLCPPLLPGMRSELGAPIYYGQEMVGVLCLHSPEQGAFGPRTQHLILAVAEQAATAVGNARRYAEQVDRERAAAQRNAQLRDLIAVSHVLHGGHDLEDTLDLIVQVIPATGGFNVAVLSLAEGDPPVLRRVAAAGIPLARLRSLQRVEQPLAAFERAFQERYQISRSYLLPHEERADWEVGLDTYVILNEERPWQEGTWHPRDMLLVPLRGSQGELLGVLSLDDPQNRRPPDREQIEVLELLANEAASAIENVRLHDELELRVRKRTEELADALRRQAAEVDKTIAIVEGISDAVIVFDASGSVVLANPATKRVLDLAPERLAGRSVYAETALAGAGAAQDQKPAPGEGACAEQEDIVRALLQVARSAKRSLDGGQDLVDVVFQAAGRVIHASFSPTAVRTGEPLTVVAVLRDITREAELDRRKSESIAMAAHELRAPMTAITSYADVLLGGVIGSLNQGQREFVEVIKANAARLTALVNNLLDVARMESEGWTLDLRPVSLADVVAEAVKGMQRQIEDKGQVLIVDVSADLPEVMADRDWMIQVVTNLLSNAYKYSSPGSQVAVRGTRADDQLRLDVQDSGMGISAQDQKHLFTRFFRAEDAITTQERGTGLGLAICREIIVRHGGQVQVDSELGKGSTFSILLPLAEGQFGVC